MGHKIEIVKAETAHAYMIKGDFLELKRMGNMFPDMNPQDLLARNIEMSLESYTGFIDDVPVCVFGIYAETYLSGRAIPWMIATAEIKKVKREFFSLSKEFIEDALERYPVLYGSVDANFTNSIRWLSWLGFHLTGQEKVGNITMHTFEMRK